MMMMMMSWELRPLGAFLWRGEGSAISVNRHLVPSLGGRRLAEVVPLVGTLSFKYWLFMIPEQ